MRHHETESISGSFQNSANPTNEPLKPRASTLSRTDLIAFQIAALPSAPTM
jgi:hypothetical protein